MEILKEFGENFTKMQIDFNLFPQKSPTTPFLLVIKDIEAVMECN